MQFVLQESAIIPKTDFFKINPLEKNDCMYKYMQDIHTWSNVSFSLAIAGSSTETKPDNGSVPNISKCFSWKIIGKPNLNHTCI